MSDAAKALKRIRTEYGESTREYGAYTKAAWREAVDKCAAALSRHMPAQESWDHILEIASKDAAERVAPPPKGPLGVKTVRYRGWELDRDDVAKQIRLAFEIVLRRAPQQPPSEWQVCEVCGGTIVDVEGMTACKCRAQPPSGDVRECAEIARFIREDLYLELTEADQEKIRAILSRHMPTQPCVDADKIADTWFSRSGAVQPQELAALIRSHTLDAATVRADRDKEWITACVDVLGMSSGLMCPTGPEGIRAMVDSLRAAALEEAAKDVCMYCGGRGLTHERSVQGPNSAGNYTHQRKGDLEGVTLCRASPVWARIPALAPKERSE